MSKSEIGEVITVSKGPPPLYQVRLARGEIVAVEQAKIQPARMSLLPRGVRLRVTHDLGRVMSASTDLALALSGQVHNLLRRPDGLYYRVEMEQGEPLLLKKEAVTFHPEHDLSAGARLEIRLEDKKVSSVRLVAEDDQAVVVKIELPKRSVTVHGKHCGSLTVRLPGEAIRQLNLGECLDMQVHYDVQGERKVVLARLAEKNASKPIPPEPDVPPKTAYRSSPVPATMQAESLNSAVRTPHSTIRTQHSPLRPAPQTVEAEILGIDPLYLARVKREHHRFEIVSFLEQHAGDGLIEWYRLHPGRPARIVLPGKPLSAPVQQAVQAALPGFSGFYQHQARALDAIRSGRNLVIVTQTASGKTLSYNPAVFEFLAANPNGHALYLFPLNALMTDQKEKIDAMTQALSSAGIKLNAAILRGGMGDQRAEIARQNPHILATNPEMLSVMLNEARQKWAGFFTSLQFIIIDEVHSYHGIFGVHMSGLVRRLLLTARQFGAAPQVILSSATVNNPLDLAARLTGLPEASFDLLDSDQDGSQQADKHWAVLNPDWGSANPRFSTYQDVAAEVFVELLTRKNARGQPAPLHTILFCRSIGEVKTLSRLVEQRLRQRAAHLRGNIKSYVSAELTHEAKRDIYEGLRTDRYLGVISTNALEAGIDIGSLDACIIVGFPFAVMALRQMAGRVGRKAEGLVLFIPHPLSAHDQYYRDHPDLLLSQPPELFVVDPQNPYIARKHINAAAYALGGLSAADLLGAWGERGVALAAQALKDGAMRQVNGRWMGTRRDYSNATDAYAIQGLRSNAQQPYLVCKEDSQPCQVSAACFDQGKRCSRRVTILDRPYIYRDCHPGAIYEATDNSLFRVTQFDDAQHVVRLQELPQDFAERTYAELDLTVAVNGAARGKQVLAPGVEMAWGDATVTRLFTGYYRYTLHAVRRCRRCRKEYDETIDACPICGRMTEVYYNHSKAERQEFPEPHKTGFKIELKTVACWLSVAPELETRLDGASPCKLPGDSNQVQRWLRGPLDWKRLPARLHVTAEEQTLVGEYHQRASQKLAAVRLTAQETLLYPGVYGQCLLSHLRSRLPESRALELFQALTGYPVTDNLQHVCRQCQTSTLLTALHTLEHAVDARYPSVALGDRSDLGAYTTLGHSDTGLPTVFWFDNVAGGLGAAEKVFEQFARLLETGLDMLQSCACTTLEGCPRCSHIPDCAAGNESLNKLAGIQLIALLLGRTLPLDDAPFIYRKKRAADFERAYHDHQYASAPHGMGEESTAETPPDSYQLLRLQPLAHSVVVDKAFEVRSQEIDGETPPVRAVELTRAYQDIRRQLPPQEWRLDSQHSPYEALEVLPSASQRMVQQIYRVIALQLHPDANPTRKEWANEMMKRLNVAYERIIKERG